MVWLLELMYSRLNVWLMTLCFSIDQNMVELIKTTHTLIPIIKQNSAKITETTTKEKSLY